MCANLVAADAGRNLKEWAVGRGKLWIPVNQKAELLGLLVEPKAPEKPNLEIHREWHQRLAVLQIELVQEFRHGANALKKQKIILILLLNNSFFVNYFVFVILLSSKEKLKDLKLKYKNKIKI